MHERTWVRRTASRPTIAVPADETIERSHRSRHQPSPAIDPPTIDARNIELAGASSLPVVATGPSRVRRSAAPAVQFKLVVGAAHDPAEAAADRMADQALARIANPTVDSEAGQAQPDGAGALRRSAFAGGAEGGQLDDATARRIDAERGRGRPLDEPVRRSMEAGFGADFSGVRVHDGETADGLNRDLSARAFTAGSDIFFRAGEYRPSSGGGQQLLAHELAHTVQQGTTARREHDGTIRRALSVDNTNWDEAASINATSIDQGQTGVFFLKDKSGGTVIVKPASGAARAHFGNEVMSAVGAETVKERPVLLASPEGKKLLKVMHKLASKYRKANKTAKGQNPVKLKIQKQLESGANDSVLVMEGYQNLTNLEELQESAELETVFERMRVNGFYTGIGRIHAGDMFMGNEDRLDKMHAKNIFVNMWSGQAVGLDTDVNATGFDQVTKALPRGANEALSGANAASIAGNEVKDYVTFAIDGSMGKKDYAKKNGATANGRLGARGGSMSTSDARKGFDASKLDGVFDDFVDRLINQAQIVGRGKDAFFQAYDWTGPRAQFKLGVAQGIAELVKKADALEAAAVTSQQNLGADALFDPRVFRIRTMYAQLMGMNISDADSRKVLELYAEDLLAGGTIHDVAHWINLYVIAYGTANAPTLAPQLPKLPPKPSGQVKRPGASKRRRAKVGA